MENPTKKAVGSLALRKQRKKSPKLEKKIGAARASRDFSADLGYYTHLDTSFL